MLVRRDGSSSGNLGGGAFEAKVQAELRSRLGELRPKSELKRYYMTETAIRGEPTGMVCGGMAEVFLEVLSTDPVLIVCGGGPVGQALAANAALCGFEVAVADDRPEFRRPELFPEGTARLEIDRDHSGSFLEEYYDRELAVAIVSRCWETDLAALEGVLRQRPPGLSYLGLMGAPRKIERVRERLAEGDLSLDGIQLHAPIGLDLGGTRPGESAVSILAEIIQARSRLQDVGSSATVHAFSGESS